MRLPYKLPFKSPTIKDILPASFCHQRAILDLLPSNYSILDLLKHILVPNICLGSILDFVNEVIFKPSNDSQGLHDALLT